MMAHKNKLLTNIDIEITLVSEKIYKSLKYWPYIFLFSIFTCPSEFQTLHKKKNIKFFLKWMNKISFFFIFLGRKALSYAKKYA